MAVRLAALALVGCASTFDMTPVIDSPVDDPTASVFPDLDQIVLTAAHAGNSGDLISQTFSRGQVISLANVPLADDLVIHMTGKASNNDVAYGRTCPFPAANGASPHLFFSRSQKFATLGVSPDPRLGGAGFTYHDGSGLLVGGTDATGAPLVDVERFEPQTGEHTTIGQIAPRKSGVVSSVGTGQFQVVVISGTDPTDATGLTPMGFLELVEVDVQPAAVTRIDDARIARSEMTATALTDGRVIAIGGRLAGNVLSPDVDEIKFDTTGTLAIRLTRGTLAVPRVGHTATRLGDDVGAQVLVAGGLDATNQPVALGELFKPLDDHFADPTTFRPMLNIPRSQHAAARLPDGSVLILGGVDASGKAIRTVERFAVDTGFVELPDGVIDPTKPSTLPAGAPTLDFATTTLPDGRILITGGRVDVGSPAQALAFVASLNTNDDSVDIIPTDPLAVARANPQAVLLCDGTVLISGGTDTSVPAERYNPPATDRR